MARDIPDNAELVLATEFDAYLLYWGFFLEAADRLEPKFLESFCDQILGPALVGEVGRDSVEKDDVASRMPGLAEILGISAWLREEWSINLEPKAEEAVKMLFAGPVVLWRHWLLPRLIEATFRDPSG